MSSGKLYGNLNHNRKQSKNSYDPESKALWLPWPPVEPVSKPLQIIWMAVVPGGETNNQPPPLIANPPSQPLLIPSHVANALLLTR